MAPLRRSGAALVLLLLAACGTHHPGAPITDQVSSRAAPRGEAAGFDGGVEIQALVIESPAPTAPVDRQIIREANASVEVSDLAAAEARVLSLVVAPGFLESTDRGDEYVHLQIRVPATGLDGFLAALDDLGDVERLSVSTRDVTEQLVDWQARLDNLIELRDRLRQLLDRAESVQDLVMVERELSRVQSEIDSITGRLESVRGQVALSRVSLILTEARQLGPLGYLFYGIGKVVGWLFVID